MLSAVSNGLIAFHSERVPAGIYVMNADGSGQTSLTAGGTDAFPTWSPDGSKIAFMSYRDGKPEIYVMNADGSGQTRLTNNPAEDMNPAWSPDGSKIAFTSLRDGIHEIYVMNADGTGQINLTRSPEHDDFADWSPDGSKIAFFKNNGTSPGEIYVMNADGTQQTQLTATPRDDHAPAWSPDGSKIAFTSGISGSVASYEIYVMNANGSGQMALTNNSANDANPAWSPDGTKIVFSSLRDGGGIYVMNPDGTEQTRVTNSPDGGPAWQPVVTTVSVQIDIKPGGQPNSINLASQGVIPIALFGSATFDVSMVDIGSVLFAGASVAHYGWEDVNGDGLMDLMLHFRTQNTNLRDLYAQLLADADTHTDGKLDAGVSTRQTVAVSLTGALTNGEEFSGADELDLFFSGKALRDLLAELTALGMI